MLAIPLGLTEGWVILIGKRVFREKELNMLYYAVLFLGVGLIAGVLNMAGVATIATQISSIPFFIGVVLLAIHLVTGRTVRVP